MTKFKKYILFNYQDFNNIKNYNYLLLRFQVQELT